MDWVCRMSSLVSKMDFKNISPYGLVEDSHTETCAKPQHTHQKNAYLFYKMEFLTRFLIQITGEAYGRLDKLLLTTSAN